jgi:DNA polymerase III subunit gamma/tau
LEDEMSLDTKYRPQRFQDVIGQKGTIQILKNLVKEGKVFEKSYVFAGPSGTGKTTTARILARAMLCDHLTPEGEPCNTCTSCREIIEGTASFNFVEMDAANNSGVDTIRQIVGSSDYYTLGGKERRIYLIDEAHRLTKEAMDALLKPMEDNVPGTGDKRLVCLFCTTEPEKLRDTIKARCMTFGIREPQREEVVERLKHISDQEGLVYEEEALDMIFASGRGHIRDMVNALERVSRVGDITVGSTREQLGLTATANYYKILSYLGSDLAQALQIARETVHMVGAPTVYYGLAESALGAYRTSLDQSEGIASVDLALAKAVMTRHGDALLQAADRILTSSKKMDETVLLCELVVLHRFFAQGIFFPAQEVSSLDSLPPAPASPLPGMPAPKQTTQEEVAVVETPKPSLSNQELSRDPAYSDYYGDNGSQFVREGRRIETSEDTPDEVEVPAPVVELRHPTQSSIEDVRSLFDD